MITKPMNTGGWIARATKLPAIKPAATVSGTGAGADSVVLLLHGFTGNAQSLQPLTQRLASAHRCVAVDLIGHGATKSPPDIARYSLGSFCKSLDMVLADAELAGTAQVGTAQADAATPKAHIVGYSLGGRAALTFASERPQSCASLTLIGASPGIADPNERLQRRRDDYALAKRIARHGINKFVQEWTALPIWDSLRQRIGPDAWQASLAQRASSHPLGLAHSLRGAGAGAMTPLWDKLSDIAMPTLALAGEEDTKFASITETMSKQMPNCRTIAVPQAGHAAHLEQPDAVADLILSHLALAIASPAPLAPSR